MKIAKVLTAGTIIGFASTGTPAIAAPTGPVSTHEVSTDLNAPSMTYYKLNDSQLGLGSNTYTFDVSGSGVATATNNATGVSEVLPGQASDATAGLLHG